MQSEFTYLIEGHDEWFVGYCPEVPESNGQGKTFEDCKRNLAEAIALVLLEKRKDALREASEHATRGTVMVAV